MTLLVVGISHRSAPVALLEPSRPRRHRPGTHGDLPPLRTSPRRSCCRPATGSRSTPRSTGSTAGVVDVTETLASHRASLEELTPHLYVHYEDRAVQHLFEVACGLDSMVVGEAADPRSGPRGAARGAGHGDRGPQPQRARPARPAGRQAGSRGDRHRPGRAGAGQPWRWTSPSRCSGGVDGRRVLVVGAGSMGGAGRRRRCSVRASPTSPSPTAPATAPSVSPSRVGGDAIDARPSPSALADGGPRGVLHGCRRARGHPTMSPRPATTEAGGRPLVVLDLALPRDVDPAVAEVPGRHAHRPRDGSAPCSADGEPPRTSRPSERSSPARWRTTSWRSGADRVAPTVVALRRRAADVVAAELARLDARVPDLDPAVRAEVAQPSAAPWTSCCTSRPSG